MVITFTSQKAYIPQVSGLKEQTQDNMYRVIVQLCQNFTGSLVLLAINVITTITTETNSSKISPAQSIALLVKRMV